MAACRLVLFIVCHAGIPASLSRIFGVFFRAETAGDEISGGAVAFQEASGSEELSPWRAKAYERGMVRSL